MGVVAIVLIEALVCVAVIVVHKLDAYENGSDRELRDIEIETDTEGHHYAVRKSGRTLHH